MGKILLEGIKLQITIISESDYKGGASIASYRLHKALRDYGCESFMVVKDKQLKDEFVIKTSCNTERFYNDEAKLTLIENIEIKKNRTAISNTPFSFPYPGYDLSKTEIVNSANILNIHFVRDYQSIETVSKLLKLNIPVVWTLHDQNPFTGGCHFSAGCVEYINDCQNCIQLKDNHYQIPHYVLKNKLKNWQRNLTIVTPSYWLKKCAEKSHVFSKFRIEHIPNSVDNKIFKPHNKELLRKRLGIPKKTKIILFGAVALKAKRKGFINLVNALRYCLTNEEFRKMATDGTIKLFTFGGNMPLIKDFNIPVLSFGKIKSEEKLVELYNISDFYILPSLEDNLPNTMLESLACGTPVVAFKTGGIEEAVINNKTGYTVDSGKDNELGNAILKMLFSDKKRAEMGKIGIDLINKNYRPEVQARSYYSFFKSLTNKGSNKYELKADANFQKAIEINEKESIIDNDFFNSLKKMFSGYSVEQ